MCIDEISCLPCAPWYCKVIRPNNRVNLDVKLPKNLHVGVLVVNPFIELNDDIHHENMEDTVSQGTSWPRLSRWRTFGFGHCTCWWYRRSWRPVFHISAARPKGKMWVPPEKILWKVVPQMFTHMLRK